MTSDSIRVLRDLDGGPVYVALNEQGFFAYVEANLLRVREDTFRELVQLKYLSPKDAPHNRLGDEMLVQGYYLSKLGQEKVQELVST